MPAVLLFMWLVLIRKVLGLATKMPPPVWALLLTSKLAVVQRERGGGVRAEGAEEDAPAHEVLTAPRDGQGVEGEVAEIVHLEDAETGRAREKLGSGRWSSRGR